MKPSRTFLTCAALSGMLALLGMTFEREIPGATAGHEQEEAVNIRTSYDYDAFGNVRTVSMADGLKIEYVVDAAGRRIGKKVNGKLIQGFLYEDHLRPIAELDGGGKIVSRFGYSAHGNIPDYLEKDGRTYCIIADHLGSPRLAVNISSGEVAQRIDYDEFGYVLRDTNPGFQPFGFVGGLYDAQTKLVRLGQRDYDSSTGRWISKDPILFASATENLYAYVANDPVNWKDPSGLDGYPLTRNPKEIVVPSRNKTPYEQDDLVLDRIIQWERNRGYPVLPEDFLPLRKASPEKPLLKPPKAPPRSPKAKPKACPKGDFNDMNMDPSGIQPAEPSTEQAIRG
jgi:RHS repeat-associated protein